MSSEDLIPAASLSAIFSKKSRFVLFSIQKSSNVHMIKLTPDDPTPDVNSICNFRFLKRNNFIFITQPYCIRKQFNSKNWLTILFREIVSRYKEIM